MDFYQLVYSSNGIFWVILKILDQMGSVYLEMDFVVTFGLIQVYFG